MLLEDWMGAILFLFGLVLIIMSFLSVIDVIALVEGFMVAGFSVLGFILCVTGFMMARAAMGGMMGRFRG